MNFRSILGGIVALPLFYATAIASDRAAPSLTDELPGVFAPHPKTGLRGGDGPLVVRIGWRRPAIPASQLSKSSSGN